MPAIELQHIEAAFEHAAKVFDGVFTFEQAAARLRDEHGLNVNSARDFLVQYRCMLRGEVYKRTQSSLALSYFLPQILTTRGRDAANNAVLATWKHIEYYESIEKTRLLKLRATLSQFEAQLKEPLRQETHTAKLAIAVADSLRDSSAARKARLAVASTKPSKFIATIIVYQRNPDVVAEVLLRAKGHCELCGSPAPFKSRSTGEPYLEVHHKVQLAHGGDDTVSNAVAACPNCHRREHFADA
jgi:5-methylcytosine-specific restriction enzyme A